MWAGKSRLLVSSILSVARMAASESTAPYKLAPLKLGMEVHGISLQTDPPPHVIQMIKDDVHKHRILVFRDQGEISGARHVEICRWFGEPDSTFYKHPRSPHPDVFRVSNDESEGCRGVGRTGWHIDGSFQEAPFAYSFYHIVSVPKEGDTGTV
jgi:taurine dioxygenase